MMVMSEPLRSSMNQLTTELHNLQKKCEERGDIPKKNLNELNKVLSSFKQEVISVNQLSEGRVTNTGKKSVDDALKAILFLQQILPSQTDANTVKRMIEKLFYLLSVQAQKIKGKDSKKELEGLRKKLARNPKAGSKIDKTFQSNSLKK